MLLRRLLALGGLSLFGFAAAQNDALLQALQVYPDCAQECITTALTGGFCQPTNQTCLCTNVGYQTNVSTCVAASCSVIDALSTRNSSMTSCHAPIRDHAPELRVIANVMLALCLTFVAGRFGYKIFISSMDIGLDDWTVLAATLSAIPSIVITNVGTIPNGLGKDIWTVQPERITNVLRYFYVMAWLYFLQTTLVKLSFITFFVRIFPTKGVQRLLWGTFIFVSAWGVAFVVTTIFQCRPISYFWTKWDGTQDGHCLDANSISWANAGMGIALDVWILAIPLWQLRELKLHWKKKLGVAFMFCIGAFVTIVSILRLRSLVDFAKDSNVTWGFYDISVWSTVEISVGIVCACLPAIRLLFVHFFPILAGSTMRSNTKGYQQYHDGAQSGNGRSVKRSFDPRTPRAAESSIDQSSLEMPAIAHSGMNFRGKTDGDDVYLVNVTALDQSNRR